MQDKQFRAWRVDAREEVNERPVVEGTLNEYPWKKAHACAFENEITDQNDI